MKEFAKIERAVHAIAPSVNVSIENNCVVLRGELDNWDDVVKCGRAAVSKKYLGVINDITLRGFEQKVRLPKINDKLYDGRKPDVLIVGGGISGATIAHELSKWQLDVMLVEKGYDVAVGATSRNDGCVHVGIDLTPKLVKHDYLIKGNAMYDELCDDMDVKFERTGHMMLMYYKWERLLMPIVGLWSKILKIKGMRYIDRKELLKIEPEAVEWARGAYYMPTGGMVSPYKLTVALAEHAAENGVHVCLNTAVLGMKVEDGEIKSVETNRGTIYPRLVINAAGTYADVIADMAGDRTFTIHPRKGIDVILDKKKGNLAHTSMSKMPFVHVPANWKETKGKEGLLKTLMKGKNLNETQKRIPKAAALFIPSTTTYYLGRMQSKCPTVKILRRICKAFRTSLRNKKSYRTNSVWATSSRTLQANVPQRMRKTSSCAAVYSRKTSSRSRGFSPPALRPRPPLRKTSKDGRLCSLENKRKSRSTKTTIRNIRACRTLPI